MIKKFHEGKIPHPFLNKMIQQYCQYGNRILYGPGIGRDAVVIELNGKYLVAKTDPITFVTEDVGRYAVIINGNDVATTGAKPQWFLATVLIPPEKANDQLIEKIFQDISRTCKAYDIDYCGGHTEITRAVNQVVVIGQMLGEVHPQVFVNPKNAREGDALLLTKYAGLEATSILASEREEALVPIFGKSIIQQCQKYSLQPGISIIEEAIIASTVAKVNAMHDPTEGGLATAIHELAAATELGCIIDEDSIPFQDITLSLLNHFDLNPLGVISSGALLICCDDSQVPIIRKALAEQNIPCTKIGYMRHKQAGIMIKTKDGLEEMPRFDQDEIIKAL